MANQLSANPFVLDTTAAAAIWTHPLHNVQVEFVDYANANDTVELQDKNGHVIWRGKGTADLHTLRSGRVGWVEGLLLPVTDSDGNANMPNGKLIIYFE